MIKFKALILAGLMMLSMVFIGGAISGGTDTSFSASAQSVTARRRKKGIARRTYAGGKYVVRRTWDGTKWVSRKVWVGSKWTARKTYKGGRKVVSRSKKILY